MAMSMEGGEDCYDYDDGDCGGGGGDDYNYSAPATASIPIQGLKEEGTPLKSLGGGTDATSITPSTATAATAAAAAVTEHVGEGMTQQEQQEQAQPLPTGPIALVAAGRAVEKIRVRYETVSKNVNVASLKSGFSAALEGAAKSGAMGSVPHSAVEEGERLGASSGVWGDESFKSGGGVWGGRVMPDPLRKASTGPPVTFTSVISSLAPSHGPQVTVPYYFITLLHLANEHGLALTDDPALGDLNIRRLT